MRLNCPSHHAQASLKMSDPIKLTEQKHFNEGFCYKDLPAIMQPEGDWDKQLVPPMVGVGWSANKGVVVIQPKFAALQPAVLLSRCWPVLKQLPEQDRTALYKMDLHAHPIEIEQADLPDILPFQVGTFLIEIGRLLARLRKQEYRSVERNLSGTVRGSLMMPKHIRHNLAQARPHYAWCRYLEYTEDNALNQILKAALRKCSKLLAQLEHSSAAKYPEFRSQINRGLNALERVSEPHKIDRALFTRARRGLSGFYRKFIPALNLAQLLLQDNYTLIQTAKTMRYRRCPLQSI